MASKKPWPRNADDRRMDAIALFDDIEYLARVALRQLEDGLIVEAARTLGLMNRKAGQGKEHLREARDIEPEDEESDGALWRMSDIERGQQ